MENTQHRRRTIPTSSPRPSMPEPSVSRSVASPLHPHEPGIPPALDPEGRCLVCKILVERDELRRAIVEHRTAINNAGNVRVIAADISAADAKHRADKRLWKAVEGD